MGIPLVALMGRQPQILDYGQQMAQAQQIQAMKNQNALAPGQQQLQQQQIQAQQMHLDQQKALNDAYQQAFKTTPDGKMQLDPDALQKVLATSGHGAAIPGVVESLTNMQKLHNDVVEQNQKIKTSTADLYGHVGAAIQQAKYDPALSHALINTIGDPSQNPQVQQLHQLVDQDPDKFKQMIDGLVASSPAEQTLKNARDVATIRAAGAGKEGELPLGPDKVAQLNQGLQGLYQVRNPGKPLPPEFSLQPNATQKDYDRLEKLTQTTEAAAGTVAQQNVANATKQQTLALSQQARGDARTDKSYQFAAGQLDKEGKPIEDAVARFGRLADTINQKTPQADAVVAPELLTVMAGGQGSGLRMNDAEISRVVGGRSNFEGLKAALNKWQLDPSKALSITDAQRGQIQSLMNEVHGKLLQKQGVIDDSRQALVNAQTPDQHRQIINDTHRKLTQIDTAGQSAGGFSIKAPNGKTYNFPDQKSLNNFKAAAGIP